MSEIDGATIWYYNEDGTARAFDPDVPLQDQPHMLEPGLGYPCVTCGHTDRHDGGGIGVCRYRRCGCDGPVTPKQVEDRERWRSPVLRGPTEREAQIALSVLAWAERYVTGPDSDDRLWHPFADTGAALADVLMDAEGK
jgi:hypothetical protein